MRLLVCGGRDFTNYAVLALAIMRLEPTVIIAGAARGADRLAATYARTHGITLEEYPADWDQYGKRAGFIRNSQMLTEGKPDMVLAMPGGVGTRMMVEIATKAGVPVING